MNKKDLSHYIFGKRKLQKNNTGMETQYSILKKFLDIIIIYFEYFIKI